MTDEKQIEEQKDDDQEYAEAYGFWVFAFGVIGAVIGYNVGAEAGFSFWTDVAFAVLGLLVLATLAYKFRKIVAVVGAIAILISVIMAIIEGIRSA